MNKQTRWFASPLRLNGSTGFGPADFGRLVDAATRNMPVQQQAQTWRPPVEVAQTEDRFVLTIEVPGLTIHDVDVEVEDDVVRVAGAHPAREESDVEVIASERRYSAFERSIRLPEAVVESKSRASLKDGVLTIDLPKQDKPKPRKLTIQSAD